MKDRAKYAVAKFIEMGWEPHQAAGIVGNLMAESGLNTGARNPGDGSDGTDSIGLGQWNSGRAQALKQFAKARGRSWDDFDTQLAFVDHELNGSESAAGRMIRTAVNVQSATEGMIMYERPAGSQNGARSAHNYSGRLNFANEAYALAQGGDVGEFVPTANPYADAEDALASTGYDIYQNTQPPTPVTVRERVAADNAAVPQGYGFGDQLYDAASSNWYTAWAVRRASEGAVDLDYVIGAEAWNDVAEKVPAHYHDYILGAGSQSAFEQRIRYAQEDMERQQRLSTTFDGGIVASLVTGLVDPVAIPLNALSGGIGGSLIRGAGTASKIAIGAASGAVTNAAMEVGAREFLDDPNTDPIMALGIGAVIGGLAGPLARNPATQVEAAALTKAGKQTVEQLRGGFIAGGQGSGGAARNTALRDSLMAQEWNLDQEDVAEAWGGSVRFDVTGQMTTAEEPLTRLIGQTFFEESVGFKDHSVVPDSVTVRATALERKLLGNFNAVFHPAMREYTAAAPAMNLVQRARLADDFRQKVYAAAQDDHPDPNTHPAVLKAAGAVKQFFDGYRKEINQSGLAALNPDPLYVPKIADHGRIAEIDNLVHHADMEAFVKEAIFRHTPDLDPSLAQRMAKGYWANIRKAGYGIEDGVNKALGLGDREAFKKAFNDNLDSANVLSDEELEKVYDILSGMIDQTKTQDGSKGVGYLKRRTLLDYGFKASVPLRNGGRMDLRMDDLFINDAEHVIRRYGRSMSGRIAFANTQIRNPKTGELLMDGIRTEADLEKLKDQVKEAWRKQDGDFNKKRVKLQRALDNIDFGWARINGIPVYGQEKNYAQWIRRLKTLQFIRLMSNMGLNQVQESWKIMATTGFRAAVSQLPAIRHIRREAASSMKKRDQLLAELQHMTGIGLDGLWGRMDFRFDDDRIGASASSRLSNTLDHALDYGQQITSSVSAMRAIHDYQQKWAIKAISQQLHSMARRTKTDAGTFDLDKLRGKDKERLASIGLGDKEVQSLFRNLLDHAETDGTRLVALGSAKWDPEVVTKFTYTLGRYTDRLVLRNDAGGLNRWMSRPVAGLFTQFRTFALGAWAKTTLYNLHHMDPRMMVMILGEIAFGTATFMVRQLPQLTTEDGADKFWDETMDPANLLKNGWARTATAAILPMVFDTALMFTPLEPQFGNARASGSPTDAIFGTPVGGHLDELGRFSSGVIDSFVDDREMAQNELRAGFRALMPLGNFMALTGIFAWMIEDRPERPHD